LKFVNKQLPQATKQSKGLKRGTNETGVAHKLTEDREAEKKTYFLEFNILSSTPLFFTYDTQ
jgi:hypothetical protein